MILLVFQLVFIFTFSLCYENVLCLSSSSFLSEHIAVKMSLLMNPSTVSEDGTSHSDVSDGYSFQGSIDTTLTTLDSDSSDGYSFQGSIDTTLTTLDSDSSDRHSFQGSIDTTLTTLDSDSTPSLNMMSFFKKLWNIVNAEILELTDGCIPFYMNLLRSGLFLVAVSFYSWPQALSLFLGYAIILGLQYHLSPTVNFFLHRIQILIVLLSNPASLLAPLTIALIISCFLKIIDLFYFKVRRKHLISKKVRLFSARLAFSLGRLSMELFLPYWQIHPYEKIGFKSISTKTLQMGRQQHFLFTEKESYCY